MKNKKNVTPKDQEIGLRIKQACKDRGYTRDRVAELLNYENPESVSPIWQGRQKLPKKKLEKLASALGVRVDYLLCDSEYATDEELFRDTHLSDIHNYKTTMDYLEQFGILLLPSYYWCCTERNLYSGYSTMSKYFTDSANKFVLSLIGDPLNESDPDFESAASEFDDDQYHAIELKKFPNSQMPPRDCMTQLSELSKRSCIESVEDVPLYSSGSVECGGNIEILYKVIFQDKTVGLLTVDETKLFFDTLDNVCNALVLSLIKAKPNYRLDYESF